MKNRASVSSKKCCDVCGKEYYKLRNGLCIDCFGEWMKVAMLPIMGNGGGDRELSR
jgi:NMD protein affecting ribosome stability and mRNA decay